MRGCCNKRESRLCYVPASLDHETQMWQFFATRPEAVKYGGQVMSEEGNAMRFMSLRRAFNGSRKLGDLLNEGKLGLIGQQAKLCIRER